MEHHFSTYIFLYCYCLQIALSRVKLMYKLKWYASFSKNNNKKDKITGIAYSRSGTHIQIVMII